MQTRKITLAAFIVAVFVCTSSAIAAPSVQVGFSPEGSARQLVLNTINDAHDSIRMLGYNLTASDITKALIAAKNRGVDVRIILDDKENQNRYSRAALNALVNAGVAVRTTTAYKIHHDKTIITDGQNVETGSFNFTKAAETANSENALLLLDMPEVARVYLKHWQSRWDKGEVWTSTY